MRARNRCEKTLGAVWLAVLLSLGIGGQATAISGGEIMVKLREKFADYKTFSAHFEKEFYWALLDKKRSQKGMITTRKPNQFRLEIEQGDVVVADGQAIWVYTEKNKQVVVSSYREDVKTPWEILANYTENYQPLAVAEVEWDGRDCYLLSLQPLAANSSVEQMRVWVDRKRWHVVKVEQLATNEDRTTYMLKDHKTNKKMKDEIFSFDVHRDVEVIDTRAPEVVQDGP